MLFSKDKTNRSKSSGTDFDFISLPGDRAVNEDCIGIFEGKDGLLFALADGLGGHGRGDEASALVVSTCEEVFRSSENLTSEDLLSACFSQAQDRLMQIQREQGNGGEMKTTLVLLYIGPSGARWCHVGDSRLYFYNNKSYPVRTPDHSVPQMLMTMGKIREQNIRGHEDRNRLVRVMGTEWSEPKYELSPEDIDIYDGDAFLLCSDGFWELVLEKEMTTALKKTVSASDWLAQMRQTVERRGKNLSMDNYSAIAIKIR